MTTPELDRFLELSVPARDIAVSLAFYLRLGFHELPVNDTRRRPYAVVTDGSIAIGLHGACIDDPCFTFVQPELARTVRDMIAAGQEPEFARLGEEEFNEARLIVHDDIRITLVEARTFSGSPPEERLPPPMGGCDEIAVRCTNLGAATVSWAKFGLKVVDGREDIVRLAATGVNIALHATGYGSHPALCYQTTQLDTLNEILGARGVSVRHSGDGAIVTAPEGTELHFVRAG